MRRLKAGFVAATVACFSLMASGSPLTDAGQKYRQHRDYPSLQLITKSLKKGMPGRSVESLLGEPDYSPADGVFYYSSDRMEYSEEADREFVVGLIVEYRTESGKVTDRLEAWQLGPIGE